ncbi:MAG: GDP-mannose 4,6-dehydratase [Candidatus Microgenomates bacterium]|jgi:dTDP-glucose 4,6-dehydratase
MGYLEGKNILVTGAGGFIGSHLVEELLKQGANVRALVFYNSFNNWGLLENFRNRNLSHNLEVVPGDIRDPQFCMLLMKKQEIIFHLAALISIPYSYVAPTSYFQTNVLGTINLLEAAKYEKTGRFIHISTSEVYGTALYTPIDEKHPLQPQSPYSASKISGENAVMSYYNAFDLPVSVVRPFNNFGPRQSARGVIPTIISQLISDKKNVSLGSLEPVRDYIFVKDTVEGLIRIAGSDKTMGETINLGTGRGYSIREIFKIISQITGKNKKIIQDPKRIRPIKSEVWKLICDNRKLKKLINWCPPASLENKLDTTIEWVANNLDKFQPNIYNI